MLKELLSKYSAVCILAFLTLAVTLNVNAVTPKDLEAEIERIAAHQNIEVGIAAIHLQTGKKITVNGDKSYPLASTYKVPIAAYAFHLVEQAKLSLDQLIPLKRNERMKWSPIYDTFSYPGVSLSLLNFLEPMLIHSDNTATDVVLNNIGGGKKVTQWLKRSGNNQIRVDRTTANLVRDFYKIAQPENPEIGFGEQFDALISNHPELSRELEAQYYAEFDADPQDHGTPLAMASLLRQIWSGKLINNQHRTLLQEIMTRCETGKDRLSGKLPAYSLPIAHKTGTIGGTVNDVGVIKLPAGKGDIAIAVYTKSKSGIAETELVDAVIADISRSVYDYFILTSTSK